MTEAGASTSHQNKANMVLGTSFRRVPFLLSQTRGLENSESCVQDIMFLKNKPWYQRTCVFLLCRDNIPVYNKREREVGLSTPEVDVICRNVDFLQQLCLAALPQEMDGMCWCGERSRCAAGRSLALLSGTCPHRSGVRKQGQNKTSAFGRPCPCLTMKAGLLFSCSGSLPVLPQRDRASAGACCLHDRGAGCYRSDVQAAGGLMARLLRGWWWGCCMDDGVAGMGGIS